MPTPSAPDASAMHAKADVAASVVMCTRNRGERLAAALDHIDRLAFDGEWEFILVDNGSTDETPQVAEAFAARTRIKHFRWVSEPGKGLSRARNRGVREARGAIIAFTDDDCYAEPDWLQETAFALQFAEVGFCGGQILLFDPADAAVTISWLKTPRTYPPNGFVDAGDIQGANMAFRREALESIGGFDPAFGAGSDYAAEDLDALWACSRLGWHGLYWPRAIVHHHHGRKASEMEALVRGYMYGRGALVAKTVLTVGHVKTGLREAGFILTRLRHSPLPWWRKVWWEAQGFAAFVRHEIIGRKSGSPEPSPETAKPVRRLPGREPRS
jgi:glycosyltransferase involved in cell wall biosynthesis